MLARLDGDRAVATAPVETELQRLVHNDARNETCTSASSSPTSAYRQNKSDLAARRQGRNGA